MKEGLLRDVGQDGIRATKGNDCGFAKKNAFFEKSMLPA